MSKENRPFLPGVFLTAQWRWLAMLNFEVEPRILAPLVPAGTELDDWNGKTYVSIVGFLFLDTKVLGVPIPFHRNFEELNLRFYVRRRGPEGWRRGVVFIKEIVPKLAVAAVARLVYNENYVCLPMRHHLDVRDGVFTADGVARYEWRVGSRWNGLRVSPVGDPQPLVAGSEEEFITEHYWGYAAQKNGGCVEYRVEHPPWRVWRIADRRFECDVRELYGDEFAPFLNVDPSSAFLAEGSEVTVRKGVAL